MKTIKQVREYLESVIEGRHRPFSLVDNTLAFAALEETRPLLEAHAIFLSIPYSDVKHKLTTMPNHAVNIELYKQLERLLEVAYPSRQSK